METESSDEGLGRIWFHQLGICVSVCPSGCERETERDVFKKEAISQQNYKPKRRVDASGNMNVVVPQGTMR